MEYVGSVEGRLETISVHKVNKFILYHALSNKAVTCVGNIDLETAKRALGHKVLVSGMLFINAKNEPLRVNVSAIRILGSKTLLKASELTGSEPDITGPLSTEEYVRSIRLA